MISNKCIAGIFCLIYKRKGDKKMRATLSNGLLLNYDISKDFEDDFVKEIYKAVPIEISMEYLLQFNILEDNQYTLGNGYVINFMDPEKEMYLNRMDSDREYSLFRSLSTLPDEEKQNMKRQLDDELGFLCEEYVGEDARNILNTIKNTIFNEDEADLTSFSTFIMNFMGTQKDKILIDLTNYLKSHVKEVEEIYYKVFINKEEGENEE